MTDITKWWQKTIAYEIYVRSFYDSNGDGIGDLNGITEKLDYLKELGAGALWLTPCYRSPQADNGYDIADYYEIDEMFGTTEDMERLISEAGKRGIRIPGSLNHPHPGTTRKATGISGVTQSPTAALRRTGAAYSAVLHGHGAKRVSSITCIHS